MTSVPPHGVPPLYTAIYRSQGSVHHSVYTFRSAEGLSANPDVVAVLRHESLTNAPDGSFVKVVVFDTQREAELFAGGFNEAGGDERSFAFAADLDDAGWAAVLSFDFDGADVEYVDRRKGG